MVNFVNWISPQLKRLLFLHREEFLFLFFKIIYLWFLFLAVLGLSFCARAFSSCGKWGPLFIAARGPLTIAASLVAEQRLQTLRLSSCGSWAQLLRGMWDLPRPGLEPMSPALAGRFSTTAPPGKPREEFLRIYCTSHFSYFWSLEPNRSFSCPNLYTNSSCNWQVRISCI